MKFALRSLARSPSYVVAAVLIVAIGIGAATAMFSTVNALVLRPVDLPEPERVAAIYETNFSRGIPFFSVSIPNYVDWKNRSTSWTSLVALGSRAMNLTGGAEPELTQVLQLSADFLPTLGVPVVLGRGFTASEDRPGHHHVALISHAYWQRRFGGKPDVLGQKLTLDGQSYTIVGVTAPSPLVQVWNHIIIPLAANAPTEDRMDHYIRVYGRLKPGVTFAQADAEMKAVAAQIWTELPNAERGWSTRLVPLAVKLVNSDVRQGLYVLLGAVGVLLLIACANLSNLMLVRATGRAHELAIRAALGASRPQLVRHLLAESLLVTLTGGALGIVLALWAIDVLRATPLPRAGEISIDLRVLAVALTASVVTGLLAGVGPALRVSRSRPHEALKARAPRSGHRSRLRDAMVVAQLALSLTLLIGAALLLRSFVRLLQVNPGFTTDHVVTAAVRVNADNPADFYDRLVERVAALPEVVSAGMISQLPLSGGGTSLNVHPAGPAAIPPTESIQANWRLIHGRYFEAMQIPLLRGQTFEQLSPAQVSNSIIVSARLARLLFGDADPLGRQVSLGTGDRPVTIVGLVGDVRSDRLGQEPAPAYYLSIRRFTYGPMSLVVKTRGDAPALIAAIRQTLKQLDPTVPLFQVQMLDELRAESLQQERLLIALLGTFASVALLLAALGTYGVVSFTVQQRSAEFGIRIAVGAQARDILQLVLGQGFRLVFGGLALGLAGAWAGSRVLAALLYETHPTDTVSYVVATGTLAAAVLIASAIPARRATKVDPLIALRAE